MCCIVPIKAIALYQKLKIMIPNMHLLKVVLIAILVSIGIVTAATAQPKYKANEKGSLRTIEVSPSVFDSFVQ